MTNNNQLTGSGLRLSDRQATRSSLAAWSWYDIARGAAGGTAGGVAAGVLGAWLAPLSVVHPSFLPRAAGLVLTLLLWGIPLTLGCSLAVGQLHRAWRYWLRRAGAACLTTGATIIPLAVLIAVLALPASPVPASFAATAMVTWVGLGIAVLPAVAVGFPHERRCWESVITGSLTGVLLGLLAPSLHTAIPYPGLAGRAAEQLSLLPLAGGLFGLSGATLRELLKLSWLQVIYGDQPGRHYPLSSVTLTIGAAPDNDLVLDPTGQVFLHHAVISQRHGEAVIEAVDAGAVLFFHEKGLRMSDLLDGDEIQIGETVLRYYTVQ